MIEIPLTQGKVAYVDDSMAHLANYKWYAVECGNNWYAARGFRKRKPDGKWGMIRAYLHHAVSGFPLHRKQVDHVDGNTLNDLQENLRHVTHRENGQNQRCHREGKTSSRYLGANWNKTRKRWESRIRVGKKRIFLGIFKTDKEASEAYQQAVLIGGK